MKKILVIEDTPSIREEVLMTLRFEGFDPVGAESGMQGIELARKLLPDLIICDIMMPELDGYGVLEELRREESTASIPFIFLTAKAHKEDVRKGMETGADDYLTKPFTTDELLAAVNARLEKHAVLVSQSQKKLEDLRGNIIRALPHELRTPLSAILGFSEVLIDSCDVLETAQIVEVAEDIRSSALRLYHLIENYLMYAQIELIATDPERVRALRQQQVTHAGEIIEQLAMEVARAAEREKDLILQISDSDATISEEDLTKIVEELLDNAFKFSDPGTPVRVTTTAREHCFALSITDHGHGMTADQVAQVGAFMQFERKLHEQQGAGLGLIIAKRLTELHGGQLTIESRLNQKTTVSLRLPRPGSDHCKRPADSESGASSHHDQPHGRVREIEGSLILVPAKDGVIDIQRSVPSSKDEDRAA